MAKPARKGLSGTIKAEAKPKHTCQGQGKRSKASHGRKKTRGQGR